VDHLEGVIGEEQSEAEILQPTEAEAEDDQVYTELPHVWHEGKFLELAGLVVPEGLEFQGLGNNGERTR